MKKYLCLALLCACGPTHDLKDVPEDAWNRVVLDWDFSVQKMDNGTPVEGGCDRGQTDGIICYSPNQCLPDPTRTHWVCGKRVECQDWVMVRDSELNQLLNYYPQCEVIFEKDGGYQDEHTHVKTFQIRVVCPSDMWGNWAAPWPPFIWTDLNCNWRPPVGV